MGGNGFVDYSLNPGSDYRSWQFKGFTVPFQVNSFDCGQSGTAVGAGSNGSAVYVDPTNNVMRTFVLSPTRTFVKVSQPLNLFPFNLTTAYGRLYCQALDSSGRSVIAYTSGSTLVQQFLPNNFLSQGGLLTVGPDGSAVSYSNALSSLLRHDKNLVLSPPSVVSLPGRPAAIATWNGAPWIAFGGSTASGLATVQPDGTVHVRSTLPNPPTVMETCGDNLVIGGIQLLVQARISAAGQIVLDVTPTSLTIRGLSCLPGGNVMYVADGRVLGIRSASGALQNYTVPGTGNLAGVATAPGPNATALLLNSTSTQGVPILAQLPLLGALFRNPSACREPNELLPLVTPRIASER